MAAAELEGGLHDAVVEPGAALLSDAIDDLVDREIVGVIPDIHFSSLHDERKATIYAEPNPNYGRNVSIKLAPGDPSAAIRHIEATWQKLVPTEPVDWQFLDDRFDALGRAGANGLADLLDEARWGLEWMLKLHPAPDRSDRTDRGQGSW